MGIPFASQSLASFSINLVAEAERDLSVLQLGVQSIANAAKEFETSFVNADSFTAEGWIPEGRIRKIRPQAGTGAMHMYTHTSRSRDIKDETIVLVSSFATYSCNAI